MNKQQAMGFLHAHMENRNLRRHCYAVAATMKALAQRFNQSAKLIEAWEIAGLLHDADYEQTKSDTTKHVHTVLEWLKNEDMDQSVYDAIFAHGWNFVPGCPEPSNDMQWSLYCCDELTGLIVAVALVRPEKKLSAVTVESVIKKWDNKGFAAGADRSQIGLCEEKLGIPRDEFIAIALSAMQKEAESLGL